MGFNHVKITAEIICDQCKTTLPIEHTPLEGDTGFDWLQSLYVEAEIQQGWSIEVMPATEHGWGILCPDCQQVHHG